MEAGSRSMSCSYTTSSEDCANRSVASHCEPTRLELTIRYKEGSVDLAEPLDMLISAAVTGRSLPGML